MVYKLNNGNGAYTCDHCDIIVATSRAALHISMAREPYYCEDCRDEHNPIEEVKDE